MKMTKSRKQALARMVALVVSTCVAVLLGVDDF